MAPSKFRFNERSRRAVPVIRHRGLSTIITKMRVSVLLALCSALCCGTLVAAAPQTPTEVRQHAVTVGQRAPAHCSSLGACLSCILQSWVSLCASDKPAVVSTRDALPGAHLRRSLRATTWTVQEGYLAECAAQGFFNDAVATTGWSYLHIEVSWHRGLSAACAMPSSAARALCTISLAHGGVVAVQPTLSDSEQVYAAGYLEGALTTERIFQSKVNTWASTFANNTCPQAAYDWVNKQNAWITTQAAAAPPANQAYWQQVLNAYSQVQGIADGYASVAQPSQAITAKDFLIFQLQAEVGDILIAADPFYRKEADVLSFYPDFERVKRVMSKNSHCSALIRLSPDGKDLFAAHTTWSSYADMLRTYKYYKFSTSTAVSKGVHFSSYPGIIHSIDDYYQTDVGLIVIETTNNVANMSLYSFVVPDTIPRSFASFWRISWLLPASSGRPSTHPTTAAPTTVRTQRP